MDEKNMPVDEEFLKELTARRDEITEYIRQSDEPIVKLQKKIYRDTYIYMHRLATGNDNVNVIDIPTYGDGMALFEISLLNELIYERIFTRSLKKKSPMLYGLLKVYDRQFGKLYERDADIFFNDGLKAIAMENPSVEEKFRNFMAERIEMEYTEAALDYYVLGPVLSAMVKTEFLQLFCVLQSLDKKALSVEYEEIAKECARVICEDETLSEAMACKVREHYFNVEV